jgi:hypothetical protein
MKRGGRQGQPVQPTKFIHIVGAWAAAASAWVHETARAAAASVTFDPAMLLMAVGAVCKFIELVVLRTEFNVLRFGFSIAGGLLIAAGSALVSLGLIHSMRHPDPRPTSRRNTSRLR